MPLELHPATPLDLPRIVGIEIASFASSPLTPILFPDGRNQASADAYVAEQRAEWDVNSALRVVKIVDTEQGGGKGEIVAFAKWYVYVGEDVRYIKMEAGERHKVLGSDAGAADEFFGGLVRVRAGMVGREEHCYLSSMCTEPRHQRRGAGMMLIDWGLQMAEKHGVPAFTEASVEGFPAYQKAGFRKVGEFEMDMGKYGGQGTRINTQMIWYPPRYAGPIKI